MPEKRKRYFLKSKEAKALLQIAQEKLRVSPEQLLGDKIEVEVLEVESSKIIILNGKPALFETDGRICPTLKFEEFFRLAPKAVVDMGAIPFVCKGANVMAPGIRRLEGEFQRNNIVYVVDEKYGKPLAVGETLYDTEEMRKIKQGVVIRNLHYVGDRIWNAIKEADFKDFLNAKA